MKMNANKKTIAIVIVLIVVVLMFGLSLYQRAEYVGNLMASNVTLSFESSTFLYNWIENGVIDLSGRMLKDPICYESPHGDRMYASYPPGFLVFPYIIARAIGDNGTLDFVQWYNMFTHLIISVFVSLSVILLYIKSKQNLVWGTIMAICAGGVAIFTKGIYYYLEFEYFAEIAVLSTVALIIFLEIVLMNQDNKKIKNVANILLVLSIYFGCFTDFYCWFVVAAIWIYHVVSRRYEGIKGFALMTLKYALPALLAVASFLLYLKIAVGSISKWIDRYAVRSSFAIDGEWIQRIKAWAYYIFGEATLYVMAASALVFLIVGVWALLRHRQDKMYGNLVGIGLICSLPAVMITVMLSEHVFYHDFPLLRFTYYLTIVIMAVVPILCSMIVSSLGRDRTKKIAIIAVLAVSIIIGIFTMGNSYMHREDFRLSLWDYRFDFAPQEFVYSNTMYNDCVFATPYQFDAMYPPVYARKPMHIVKDDLAGMLEDVTDLPDDANVDILIVHNPIKPLEETPEYIFDLAREMEMIIVNDDFTLYRDTKGECIANIYEIMDK